MEAAPAVLFHALVLPDGAEGVATLGDSGQAVEFLKDQYRHCKPILVLGAATELLSKAGISAMTPAGEPDAGLLQFDADDITKATTAFMVALGKHRHFARETDPPLI